MEAADRGAWISLDGLSPKSAENHLNRLLALQNKGHLKQVLLSHDAGWYDVANPDRPYQGYTFLKDQFLPLLVRKGFNEGQVNTLLVENPMEAFCLAG